MCMSDTSAGPGWGVTMLILKDLSHRHFSEHLVCKILNTMEQCKCDSIQPIIISLYNKSLNPNITHLVYRFLSKCKAYTSQILNPNKNKNN
ncbi:hypothetical protein HanHA300_Chr03g0075161 [Helianthus annuus]|nr:hypothetical protein HanHA300_Chr03g0075161 [Helianthus annuus]KAJ0772491.1 hypothetical protein HanOQP8_Chr03g0087931 [Helianthus annuus]